MNSFDLLERKGVSELHRPISSAYNSCQDELISFSLIVIVLTLLLINLYCIPIWPKLDDTYSLEREVVF